MGARLRPRRHQSPVPSPGGQRGGTPASRLSPKLSIQLALAYPSAGKYSSTAILKATAELVKILMPLGSRRRQRRCAPSPACGGGPGWGCFPQAPALVERVPPPAALFERDLPASGRGEAKFAANDEFIFTVLLRH